jgi:hypothetical protein
VVRTRQAVIGNAPRVLTPPLGMLVLADPCGDLQAAYDEGIRLRDLTETRPDQVQVTFRSAGVQTDFLKAKLRQYDLVHFAGHADFSDQHPRANGWRLGNGRLTAEDIRRMAGTGSMPALIFANACQSARTGPHAARAAVQAHMFDMANAFLLSGVKHYLGTFWEIPDAQSAHFALSFYEGLLSGGSVGAAVLAARRSSVARFGEETIIWAGYLLYGDPTTVYCQPAADAISHASAQQDAPSLQDAVVSAGMRAPEDRFHLSAGPRQQTRKRWEGGSATLVLLAAALWPGAHRPVDQGTVGATGNQCSCVGRSDAAPQHSNSDPVAQRTGNDGLQPAGRDRHPDHQRFDGAAAADRQD